MFFSFNTSMAGILLAICIVGLFGFCLSKKHTFFKIGVSLIIVALFAVLTYWKNRAGIVGAFAGICYLVLASNSKPKKFVKNHQWKIIFSLITVAVFFTCFTKVASTSGRLFIYKICFRLLKNNWLGGVGYGKFNVSFNHEQARYFAIKSLHTKEAMLANDGYFAFNDWLQLWIEFGIIGAIFSLIVLLFCIWLLAIPFKKNQPTTIAKQAILLPIFMASLVSYPLHNFYILLMALLFMYSVCIKSFTAARFKLLLHIVFITTIIILAILGSKYYFINKRLIEVNELWHDGQKTNAAIKVGKLYATNSKNASVAEVYAAYLYFTGKTEKAITILENNDQWNCNQKNHATLGAWYQEINQPLKAQTHLFTSLYLTPHLLLSRYVLMNFYIQNKSVQNATYWANELLNYPIKVENPRAKVLKDSARKYLLMSQYNY